jgi:serine/threonine protein kinase
MSKRGEVLRQAAECSGVPAPEVVDLLLHRAQARLGLTLREKWRLDVLLGVGGAAAVYAATHRNGSRVAVKILHPEMSTNTFVRERFLWEGYVANAVGHEGVVKVIDDDMAEDGSLFLVTELLDGETLEQRRVRLGGRLPQDQVLLAADQLLDVLAVAHAKGVVHSDLKPENVFLTGAGQVKVLDFGIARLSQLSTRASFTQTGAVVGTPGYMPPEQVHGLSDGVDARSDLWSCGAMMFFLLSGRCVHEGRNVNEQLVNAMTHSAPPLVSVAPDVGVAVARVVDRALEFSKEMRWPDAGRMQEAVRNAYIALYGRSIMTAPRLTLGEGASHRLPPWPEQAGPSHPTVPTTARPVALSQGHERQALSPRARQVGGALAFAFGIGVAAMVWMVAGSHSSGRTQRASGLAPTPAASAPGVPVVALLPTGLREAEVTDSLGVTSVKAPPRYSATRRAAATSPSTTPPAIPMTRTNCQPPYFVEEATGKQRWRLECL